MLVENRRKNLVVKSKIFFFKADSRNGTEANILVLA